MTTAESLVHWSDKEALDAAASANEASGSAPTATRSGRSKDGKFVRGRTAFHQRVTADGSSGFKAESGRYHLFVSYACPWANRTLIVRKLKGLEKAIAYTSVDWLLDRKTGWAFSTEKPGCAAEPFYGAKFMRELYNKASEGYDGQITVPVLWDTKTETIVNNESEEIIRMLNTEFNEFCETDEQRALHLYPEEKRSAIDAINVKVYPNLNNGVYRAGLAGTQEAYNEVVTVMFATLDSLEETLSRSRYLVGDTLTEADVRLFVTLIRFDVVYVCHFKCNKARIEDYPNLKNYVRDLYQMPEFKDTVNFEHIKKHYFQSHLFLNPSGLVPIGPDVDYTTPHDRDEKFPK